MTEDTTRELRRSVLTALAARWRSGLGRTALMKSLYFLQTLRGVPLRYRFTLYTYGPYDKEVLYDLAQAEAEGRVSSRLITYPNGNEGYVVDPGPQADTENGPAERYRVDIEWVVDSFCSRSAADLEMASTIVFAARSRNGHSIEIDELAARVHEIKPHFTLEQIRDEATRLREKGLLAAAA